MFCKYCGKELKDGAKFCPYCGKEQVSDDTSGNEISVKKETGGEKEAVTEAAKSDTVKTDKDKRVDESKNSKKGFPIKRVIIAAVCVVAVAGVIVAGVVIARNRSNDSNELTASDGSTESVDLSGKSDEYETAYNYASANAARILQREMQDELLSEEEDDALREKYADENGTFVNPIAGDEDAFEAYVDELDSQKFESYIEQEIPEDSGSTYQFPSYFADTDGVAAYFNGIDVVTDFRDTDESIFEVCVTNRFSYDELDVNSPDFLTDTFTTICVNGDYAFVRSRDTVADLVKLMSFISGYQFVYDEVNYLNDEIDFYTGRDYEILNRGMSHAEVQEENWKQDDYVYEYLDAAEGRKDALTEYLDKWENARTQWKTEFLKVYGLEGEASDMDDGPINAPSEEVTRENRGVYHKFKDDEDEDSEKDTASEVDSASEDEPASEEESASEEDAEYEDDNEYPDESDNNDTADESENTAVSVGGTTADYVYQVIDKDNNRYYSYLDDLHSGVTTEIGTDGKVQIYQKDGDVNRIIYAFDKDGNSIYDSGQALYYPYDHTIFMDFSMKFEPGEVIGITPSGNGLACEQGNDLEHGDYYTILWAKADGSTEEIMKVYDIQPVTPVSEDSEVQVYGYNTEENYSVYPTDYVYTDEWKVSYGLFDSEVTDGDYYTHIIIDLATGEYTEKEDQPFDVFNPQASEEDEEVDKEEDKGEELVVPDSYVQISPNYYMDTETWNVYSKDNMDSRVTQLSDGQGVQSLCYNEEKDVYWVITNTSYYYKMDGDFNQVAEPRELRTDQREYNSPYGVFIIYDNGIGILYDEYGNIIIESPTSGNMLVCGFITFDLEDAYNLSTDTFIRVTKAEAE